MLRSSGLLLPRLRIPARICARLASGSPQSSKTRRMLRRRVPQLPREDEPLKLCVSASKCQKYDLTKAVKAFKANGVDARVIEAGEAAWAQYPKDRDVLVLSNGSVVGWDFSEAEIVDKLVPLLQDAELAPYVKVETEDMDFVEQETTDTHSGMIGDVMYVHGPTDKSRLLDKLAFSSGMARHTKLSALEVATEELLQQVKGISSGMAEGHAPGLKTKEVDMFTGRLLQLRGNLNLYSTITETPDVYWSQPEQEALYELISKSLDVEPRISILNKKLDYAADMVSILRQHLSERTSIRLEWMIIILIMIEVAIEIRHFLIPTVDVENATAAAGSQKAQH